VVPGANDNASGVATALALAERHGGRLEHLDLWVLFTGSGEGFALGMRDFLRRHKSGLDRARTVFLNVDMVGSGTVRFATREGFVVAIRSHPQLVELCEEIADDDQDQNAFGAKAVVSRVGSDGHAARSGGYPALSVSCLNALDYFPHYHQPTDTPDNVEPEALERAFGFCSELIGRLDKTVGPELQGDDRESALSEKDPQP
jgi:Iap family predicted aminopeptidase